MWKDNTRHPTQRTAALSPDAASRTPRQTLEAGLAWLDPILVPAGFTFQIRESGAGSGGAYAWGEYVRDDRRIELHFRYSLGMVRFHAGVRSLSNEQYLKALDVPEGANQDPGFSNDPLDGFRHLAHDLRKFFGEFLDGDASVLERIG